MQDVTNLLLPAGLDYLLPLRVSTIFAFGGKHTADLGEQSLFLQR